MRAILHKIKWVLFIAILGVIILLTSKLLSYKYGWKKHFNETNIIEFAESINNSESLPDNFILVYDRIFPKKRTTKLSKTLFYSIPMQMLSGKYRENLYSPTFDLSRQFYYELVNSKSRKCYHDCFVFLSFALNKYTTPEKCFDFIANNSDFLYNQIGISQASNFYFKKEIMDLSDKEIVGLILMLQNPALYNPRRYPERYRMRVDYYLEKL